MPKVRAFQVRGLEMWFYCGDHRPRISTLVGRVNGRCGCSSRRTRNSWLRLSGPPHARVSGSDLRALKKGVLNCRDKLLAEWESSQMT